jgi:hypothetical protein
MALSDLSSSQLQKLIQLIKEKESLQAELDKVNHSLTNFESGTATPKEPTSSPKRSRRRRRGHLKDSLLKVLQAAGKGGLTIKELSTELKADSASVYSWFYTTGKKVKGIKKVGTAKFAYNPA